MEELLHWIGGITGPWADLYADSVNLETAVVFLHLGGLVAAGGIAFTVDRAVLRAHRDGWPDRPHLARQLHQSHLAVLVGLGVVTLSGIALTAADAEFYLTSTVYWVKIAAVVLLLVNGWFLKRSGDRLLDEPENDQAFRRLRRAAIRSGGLWALTILVGVALTNA